MTPAAIQALIDSGFISGSKKWTGADIKTIFSRLNDTPETITFSASIPFTRKEAYINHTLTENVSLTPDTTDAVRGATVTIRFTGAYTVTFPTGVGNFKKVLNSPVVDTTGGQLNVVVLFYDGVDYWYNVYREEVVATYDTDAQALFTQITTLGQPDLSSGDKTAIDTFIKGCKTANIWTKFDAIWGLAGATAVSQSLNWKNPANTNAAYRLSFSGNWANDATGAAQQASGANYMDTFWVPGDVSLLTNRHVSIYPSADIGTPTAESFDFGTMISGGVGASFYSRNGSNTAACSLFSAGIAGVASATSVGLWLLNRPGGTRFTIWKNGSIAQDKTDSAQSSGTVPTSLVLGRYRSTGAISGDARKKYIFASMGTGFSDSESSTFNTLVQALKTGLGR